MKSAYVIAPLFLLMAGCSQNARTDQAAENTRTLYIDSELADCVGVAPMKCMKIKESLMQSGNFSIRASTGLLMSRDTSTGCPLKQRMFRIRLRMHPISVIN